MLNGKLRLFLPIFFFFVSSQLSAYQFGIQYQLENSYRNTIGPFILAPLISLSRWSLDAGSVILFSQNDWEALSYKTELVFRYQPWFEVGSRASHRVQLPEPFSRTTFLGYFKLRSPRLGPFSFYWLAGWYYRMVQLEKVGVIPWIGRNSFSQQDFSTDLGFHCFLSNSTRWKLALSTVDELEVYNLNHPFLESTFSFQDLNQSAQWSATIRTQHLLGFGRLDRLIFQLSFSKIL